MFRQYFCPLLPVKITEKAERTKKAAGKTSVILSKRYNNCLDAVKFVFSNYQTKY